jgi:hypothetical protein
VPRPTLRLVPKPPTMHNLRELAFIFLSTPYTSCPEGIEAAHYNACQLVIKLHAQRIYGIYSPVLHFHEAAYYGNLPTDAEHWRPENMHKLRFASALLVGEYPGWEKSEGVRDEIVEAGIIKKPIFYINPETLELRK